MTRGTHTNDAFLATTGEQTAHDVFTQCLATDWIDQPAHTRQAELNDTKPHRAGLLDGDTIRDLLETRHVLTTAISRAEALLDRGPHDLARARQAKAAAESDENAHMTALRAAEDAIVRYDRPLHRRRHELELRQARVDVERFLGQMTQARNESAKAESRIADLEARRAEAVELLAVRPAHDATVAAINERLAQDARTRSRAARLEHPAHLVDSLGPRPTPGPAAHAWDAAAGELDQHQAAFSITDGLGPRTDLHGSFGVHVEPSACSTTPRRGSPTRGRAATPRDRTPEPRAMERRRPSAAWGDSYVPVPSEGWAAMGLFSSRRSRYQARKASGGMGRDRW